MWLVYLLSFYQASSIELQNLVVRIFFDAISRIIFNVFDLI